MRADIQTRMGWPGTSTSGGAVALVRIGGVEAEANRRCPRIRKWAMLIPVPQGKQLHSRNKASLLITTAADKAALRVIPTLLRLNSLSPTRGPTPDQLGQRKKLLKCRESKILKGHSGKVVAMAWSHDDSRLITADNCGAARRLPLR